MILLIVITIQKKGALTHLRISVSWLLKKVKGQLFGSSGSDREIYAHNLLK